MPLRIDVVHLDAPFIDEYGCMTVPAVLTRPGVFVYRKSDGSVLRELRHPDDVFDPASVASAKRRPVVDDHPYNLGGLVTPDNARRVTVGVVGDDVQVRDGSVAGTITVYDGETQKKIVDGKRAISMGYLSDMVSESGVFDGEPYDCRQVNIRYNHLAIVHGSRVSGSEIKLDSDDAVVDSIAKLWEKDSVMSGVQKELPMVVKFSGAHGIKAREVKLDDDKEIMSLLDEHADLIKAHEARIAELEGRLTAANEETKKAESEKVEAETKLDAAMKPEAINALVSERAELVTLAKGLKLDSIESVDNAGLRRKIVSAAYPEVKLDSKDAHFVDGMFAAYVGSVNTGKVKSLHDAGKVGSHLKNDSADPAKVGPSPAEANRLRVGGGK